MPNLPSFPGWLAGLAEVDNPHWRKTILGDWIDWDALPDDIEGLEAVYIIFNENDFVYVGEGNIVERMTEHRSVGSEFDFSPYPNLKVTWNLMSIQSQRSGVEKYLQVWLNPRLNRPIIRKINLPF